MAKVKSDSDPQLALYLERKTAFLAALKSSVASKHPSASDSTRAAEQAIAEAIAWYGYQGQPGASTFGSRTPNEYEKTNYVPTGTIAAYFAIGVARYGSPPWAKDDPMRALRQVYSYFLWGSQEPPQGADTTRLDALTRRFPLYRAKARMTETPDQLADMLYPWYSASPYAIAELLKVLSESIVATAQERAEDEPSPAPLPCDETGPFVGYLVMCQVISRPPTEDERLLVAEKTGIPLERVRRLMCGDEWTEEEAAAVEAWAKFPGFTLEAMRLAHTRNGLNANHNAESGGTVRNSQSPA